MHNQGDIWKLMGKKLSGEADREELRQLQVLLEDNPHLIYSLEVLTNLWQSQSSPNTSKNTPPPPKSGNEFFPGTNGQDTLDTLDRNRVRMHNYILR